MKVAVLGSGNMGGSVLSHLRQCDRVSGIVAYDPNPDTLASAGRMFGVDTTQDLDVIWRDQDVRLVFVTSPNHTHRDLTVQALNAGKAVMCEKPIATTLEHAREVVELSERLGAFFQIGFELRYSTLYTTVKGWIDAGLLGDVVNTHCIYVSCVAEKTSWRTRTNRGGSLFGEKLCHYVDLPRWWVGSPVTQVLTLCSPNVVPYYEIHDNYHTTYRFKNGAASHLSYFSGAMNTKAADPAGDWLTEMKEQGYELRYIVQGTRGMAQTDVYGRRIKRWAFGDGADCMASTLVEDLTWGLDDNNRYGHNTLDQAHDIVRRVADGLPPFTPARDSLDTMRVCFAAERSVDTGRMVSLDEL